MNLKKYKLIISLAAAVLSVSPLYGVSYDSPTVIISPVLSALGGAHTTMNEGFSSLLNNPAGFVSAPQEVSLAELNVGLKGPVFDIANMIISQNYTNITSIFSGIYAGLDISGPIAFGYIGNGLGFGIYENTISKVSSVDPLTLKVIAGEEILLCGGYAVRIPVDVNLNHVLDAGVLLKGIFKGTVDFKESVLNIMNISLNSVMNEPFDFSTGIGFDLGLRYSYKNTFSFGLVGRDVYSPAQHNIYSSLTSFSAGGSSTATTYGIVPFRLDGGAEYTKDFSGTSSFVSRLKIFLDYYDILDFWLYPSLAVNPVLHVGLGTEVTLLDILSLRAGFNEGLFSAGLGLDLHFFKLDAAMFGTELSTEPGLHPVYNIQIGVSISI